MCVEVRIANYATIRFADVPDDHAIVEIDAAVFAGGSALFHSEKQRLPRDLRSRGKRARQRLLLRHEDTRLRGERECSAENGTRDQKM
jgi:hypothetical protein